MRRKWLLLALGAAILLPVPCFLYLTHEQKGPAFRVHGGGMHWNDGPDVDLSSTNASKLNQEIASLLEKKYPNDHYQFTVTSTGKRSVSYNEGRVDMSDSVWNEMSEYAGKRVMELAEAQAVDEKAETAK